REARGHARTRPGSSRCSPGTWSSFRRAAIERGCLLIRASGSPGLPQRVDPVDARCSDAVNLHPVPMKSPSQPELVRAIGRWSLAALVINCIIGSGIFGLPSVIAGQLGRWAPLGYLGAAVGMGVIMGCFAEVASRFTEAGGPYLYAREAFGAFVGIETGWLTWLPRLAASAAAANLFVDYLGELAPAVTRGAPRAALLTVIIGALLAVNVRGVRFGARASNFFTLAKLIPL